MSIQNSTALDPLHFQVKLSKSSNPVTPPTKNPLQGKGYGIIGVTKFELSRAHARDAVGIPHTFHQCT
jgi:hypothetical protein